MRKLTVSIIIYCLAVTCCASKQTPAAEKPVPIPAPAPAPVTAKPSVNMVRLQGAVITEKKANNGPEKETIINPFYLAAYPVTQKQYQEVTGQNISYFKGDNLPVESIKWSEAVEFCNRLSLRDGLTPAYKIDGENIKWNRKANGYRLPTEIEWEYACRAGSTTPFNTGSTITTNQANYDGRYPYNSNVRGEYRAKTTPVGSFAANAWGLYDMHGNVWEWCWDDPKRAQDDDMAVLSITTIRIIRGGGWSSSGISLFSNYRTAFQPFWSNNYIGFRLARNAE